MVIDSHCHLVHGNAEHTRYTPEQIVRTMDAASVERAIVFAMSVTTAESIRLAAAARSAFPDRLIPYAYALPGFDGSVIDQLREALGDGFAGVKVHAGECPVTPRTHEPLMALAEQTQAPILVDVVGRPQQAEWMLSTYPRATIIIAHIGKYRCTDEALHEEFIALAERYPNAVLDVSGVVLPWVVVAAVRRIGSGRVAWGSDGPHPLPDTTTFLADGVRMIRQLDLEAREIEDLLSGTIRRLLSPTEG